MAKKSLVTPAMINEYAILKTLKARIEKREKELKEVLEPEADIAKPFTTKLWCLTYNVSKTTNLSTVKIREKMGSEWCKEFEYEGERKELKPTCLTEAAGLVKKAEMDVTVAAQLLSVLIDQGEESLASKAIRAFTK